MSDKNTLTENEASTIEPRLPGSHKKPGYTPDNLNASQSQDADRHNKTRHQDSEK